MAQRPADRTQGTPAGTLLPVQCQALGLLCLLRPGQAHGLTSRDRGTGLSPY